MTEAERAREMQRILQAAERVKGVAEKLKKSDEPSPLSPSDEARAMVHRLLSAIPDGPVVEAARKLIAPPAPPPPLDLGLTAQPILSQERGGQVVTDRWLVAQVGAGGVGARLAPLIVKHLINGDMYHIIDGDVVEAKNIARQHFTPQDVGLAKAQVVAARARATAPRDGIEVGYTHAYLDDKNLNEFGRAITLSSSTQGEDFFGEGFGTPRRSVLLLTCVDTLKARKDIEATLKRFFAASIGASHVNNLIWVDCGNAVASGQALVMGVMTRLGVQTVSAGKTTAGWALPGGYNSLWPYILPGFLDRDDDPVTAGDACAIRLDPQTVLANTWAALAAASIAIPILSMAGMRTMGVAFSTTGQTVTAPLSANAAKNIGSPTEPKLVMRRLV